MAHSILKYGSYIRGNSDKYSDKDILLVADDYNEIQSLKTELILNGWSVSIYTYSKLHYLSKNGYLFVKHLLTEGVIEYDPNNRLQEILNIFSDIKKYDDEIIGSQNFMDFVKEIPNNEIGYSWLCDNIYITLRNLLIYKSAKNNKFVFSYPDLILNLLNTNSISLKEYKVLIELRVLKSAYRNSFQDIVPCYDYIQKLLYVVKRIGVKTNFIFTNNKFTLDKKEFNKITSPYKKLRIIELYLKSNNINDPYLNKCITNPQMYANYKSINKVYGIISRKTECNYKIFNEN